MRIPNIKKLRRKLRKYVKWHIGLEDMYDKLKLSGKPHTGKEIVVKHDKTNGDSEIIKIRNPFSGRTENWEVYTK